jgi:threonine dehydrogenase-like Zn-dependent dehydrogenase
VVTRLGGTAIPPGPGLEDRIVDATSRPDADVSFDTAGAPMSFTTAVQTTAKLGRIMLMATPRAPIGSALGPLMAREIEVRSSFAYCDDFPPVIEAVADGRFPLDSWVSTMTLTDLVSAFELLRRGERVKVLIDPSR